MHCFFVDVIEKQCIFLVIYYENEKFVWGNNQFMLKYFAS